jgi:hypothetical protein
MELSRREKEVLAQIEREFTPKETVKAWALNPGAARWVQYSPIVRTWLGLLGLLALGLTLIPVAMVLLDLGPIGAGVLALGIVTPWTLLAAARLPPSNNP